MSDDFTIVIGSPNGERVVVAPTRTADREGWVASQVEVTAWGFGASFPASLRIEDFETFRSGIHALQADLSGEAEFRTLEDQLELTLAGSRTGHVVVEGVARAPLGSSNNTLRFSFEIDQTHLSAIARSLDRIIEELGQAS